MIRILWTKNHMPFSRLICWLSGKPVSHAAVCFSDRIVFHSNPMGVHINSYFWFKNNNTIVYERLIEGITEAEEELAYEAMTAIEMKGYDFGSVLFWGWRLLLLKFFRVPLPRKNLWSSKRFFNCLEALGQLPDWVWPSGIRPDASLDCMTPYEVAIYMGAVK